MSNGNMSVCQTIKDAYLNQQDVNVIVMDWSVVSESILYPLVAYRTQDVAVRYAKFLSFLISHGANPKMFHLLGHSLGAHVSGIAASKFTKTKIGRVTGT